MTSENAAGARQTEIRVPMKILLGCPDHGLTLALSALSLVYVFFLERYIGLSIGLAAAVPLIGRFVDAITDPLMGRISDVTRTRFGRRRPYLLAGALPFGISFALLWFNPGFESEFFRFAFCVLVYVFYSLTSTVVGVPYVALIPEVVPGYEQRTSVSAYRGALTVLGTGVAAVGFRPLAAYLGEGSVGFFQAGLLLGIWITLPFLVLCLFVRERPEYQQPVKTSFLEGIKMLAAHRAYRRLSALYILGRVAMDIVGMVLLFYFTYWLLRPGDFEITMLLFLGTSILSLPLWVYISRRTDKHRVFVTGCLLWSASQLLILLIEPDWPRWVMFGGAICFAAGYAVVDMMPWSMLADVVDEDELLSHERREGVYGGSFTFIRKLGGAIGVFVAGFGLELAGFDSALETQPESALWAIRCVASIVPSFFLVLAALIARGYSLDRAEHARILGELETRRGG
ncbi:MAG: MFS transporter [bacterium]|nr:MFS transporter [bacterium]